MQPTKWLLAFVLILTLLVANLMSQWLFHIVDKRPNYFHALELTYQQAVAILIYAMLLSR